MYINIMMYEHEGSIICTNTDTVVSYGLFYFIILWLDFAIRLWCLQGQLYDTVWCVGWIF